MTIPPRLAALGARIGVTGAIIAVLALALVWSLSNQYADIKLKGPLGIGIHFEGWKPKAQRLAAEKKGCETRLKASNGSIDLLQKVITDRNAEIRRSADEFAAAKARAAVRQAELDRVAVASDARIARLREVAGRPAVPGQCATPTELRELAEGL